MIRRLEPACLAMLALPFLAAHPLAASRTETFDAAVELIRERHAAPYRQISRRAFDDRVTQLRTGLVADANGAALAVAIMRVVHMLGDRHSELHWSPETPPFDRVYGLRFGMDDEGLFVSHVRQDGNIDPAVITMRPAGINGVPWQEARRTLLGIASGNNELSALTELPYYLRFPALLSELGLADEAGQTVLELRGDGGREATVELVGGPATAGQWIGPRPAAGAQPPLYLRDPRSPHWAVAIPDSDTIYAQYNAVRDGETTVATFAESISRLLVESDSTKLVLDVRRNTGGDNTLNTPLLHMILKNDSINRSGGLFVLTSPRTYSAAMDLCAWLERETHAIFVGQRTGAGPNHCGDPEVYPLPAPGLSLRLSEHFWCPSDPRDERLWIEPHVVAPTSIDHLLAGHDPALEAALEFDAPEIVEEMERTPVRHHWWSPFQEPALEGHRSWPPVREEEGSTTR